MELTLTYVFHNCFVLALDGRTLLFDPPAPPHLDAARERVLRDAVAGSDLTLLVSHAHGDHFHPGFRDLARGAARSRFVLSFDAARRAREKPAGDLAVARPGERFEIGGLSVEPFRSNDAGCAYLVEWTGRRIWFGGDLALWDWPDNDANDRALLEDHYRSVLNELAGRGEIDVAFSNFDGRLASRTGAAEFVRIVKPRVFVPMHGFGNEADLADRAGDLAAPGVALFVYRASGDRLVLPLPVAPR